MLTALLVVPLLASDDATRGDDSRPAPGSHPGPVPISEDGAPLLDAQEVDIEGAMTATPYQLPVPPTNEVTGARTAIWIDANHQVAFTWDSGLRLYVDRLHDLTPAVAHATWTRKAAGGDGTLVVVRGVPGIAREARDGEPASLTLIENGLSIQFVGPDVTVKQLVALAEELEYE
ncbi:MAG TPA: hypothetical protein VHJ34_01155 [Actinomycetota bacterium]|nr:hypothetical protein [Actinomycetota bacterium]